MHHPDSRRSSSTSSRPAGPGHRPCIHSPPINRLFSAGLSGWKTLPHSWLLQRFVLTRRYAGPVAIVLASAVPRTSERRTALLRSSLAIDLYMMYGSDRLSSAVFCFHLRQLYAVDWQASTLTSSHCPTYNAFLSVNKQYTVPVRWSCSSDCSSASRSVFIQQIDTADSCFSFLCLLLDAA